MKLIAHAKARGIEIKVQTRTRVLDVKNEEMGLTLTIQPTGGPAYGKCFDHVILATGHQWPSSPELRPGYFLSPWPASALAKIPPCEVGIRGTSLTAIDATVALAVKHGEFADTPDGRLEYHPSPGSDAFHMTMMSRKGLLPEADFFAPIPYEPLVICTQEAIDALIADDEADLLDRAFALFKQE